MTDTCDEGRMAQRVFFHSQEAYPMVKHTEKAEPSKYEAE
jgi:hypothetical protein